MNSRRGVRDSNRGTDLQVGLHQRLPEAAAESADDILALPVGEQVIGKADAVLLEEQHVGAAAGAVEAFGLPLAQKHAGFDRPRES